jgi:hypothetical protein
VASLPVTPPDRTPIGNIEVPSLIVIFVAIPSPAFVRGPAGPEASPTERSLPPPAFSALATPTPTPSPTQHSTGAPGVVAAFVPPAPEAETVEMADTGARGGTGGTTVVGTVVGAALMPVIASITGGSEGAGSATRFGLDSQGQARTVPGLVASHAIDAVVSGVLGRTGAQEVETEVRPDFTPSKPDLLTDFLPYDRASLEDAIDRFLDRVGGNTDTNAQGAGGPSELVTGVVALAVAATASKGVLKVITPVRRDEEPAPADDPVSSIDGLSGLPFPWGRPSR